MNFADRDTGRIYAHFEAGQLKWADPDAIAGASGDKEVRAALCAITPDIFEGSPCSKRTTEFLQPDEYSYDRPVGREPSRPGMTTEFIRGFWQISGPLAGIGDRKPENAPVIHDSMTRFPLNGDTSHKVEVATIIANLLKWSEIPLSE